MQPYIAGDSWKLFLCKCFFLFVLRNTFYSKYTATNVCKEIDKISKQLVFTKKQLINVVEEAVATFPDGALSHKKTTPRFTHVCMASYLKEYIKVDGLNICTCSVLTWYEVFNFSLQVKEIPNIDQDLVSPANFSNNLQYLLQ